MSSHKRGRKAVKLGHERIREVQKEGVQDQNDKREQAPLPGQPGNRQDTIDAE